MKPARSIRTAALELALPLLREQLRAIVESCAPYRLTDEYGQNAEFIRWRMTPDELEWIGPWRDAVTAVEIALGMPPSNDDGGVRYLDERQGNDG
jgi:hypothetical protein